MQVLSAFDGGVTLPFTYTGDRLLFAMEPGQSLISVLLRDPPERVRIAIQLEGKHVEHLRGQGLIVSVAGAGFQAVPFAPMTGGLEAVVETQGRETRICARYPYGRDALDRLLCATAGPAWRFLERGVRGLPLAEFGDDDGRKPIHYIIAGEDAWETAGCWTADAMIRALQRDRALAELAAGRGLLRIVPLVSPYSATTARSSYCTLAGAGIYGAATWGDAEPPEEFALLRGLVEKTIGEGRLGCLLTIHSWQGMRDYSGLEAIRSAGGRVLSPERQAWTSGVLDALIAGVPRGKAAFPERIWHPGLARDHLLGSHDAISFRIEITTAGQGLAGFRASGERLLANLLAVPDWSPVQPRQHNPAAC